MIHAFCGADISILTGRGQRESIFGQFFAAKLLLMICLISEMAAGAGRYSISGNVNGADITVTLCGHSAQATVTDAAGNYSFHGLETGRYIVILGSSGYVFTPDMVAVDVVNSDVAGIDSLATAKNADQKHSVQVKWAPSPSADISGYHLYRGTTPGGPYKAVKDSALITDNGYEDSTVRGGQTYYYVSRAVARDGVEGPASSEIAVNVPNR